MRKLVPLLALVILSVSTPSAHAGEDASLSVGATYFLDYFVDLTDYPEGDDTPTRGFRIDRTYVTVKKKWGDVTFRSTTDIDTKFGTGNLNVTSKYAYLEHKGLIQGAKVIVGQHSAKTHGWTEEIWRYRSIAKTMSDRGKWTNSAEFGLGVQGKAMDKKVKYYLDVNNGNGYRAPVAKGGTGLAARVAVNPSGGLWVSGLATANAPGGVFDDDTATNYQGPVDLDGFDIYLEGTAGWEAGRGSIYAQYGMFTDEQYESGGLNANGAFEDRKSAGVSVFGRAELVEGTHVLARFDWLDPDTDISNDSNNLVIAGFSHELAPGLHVQPNVQVLTFESGADTETEAMVTVFGSL